MTSKKAKIAIQNINCPGQTSNVDAVKYAAMKKVLLKVLPLRVPGLTQKELLEAIKPHLPQDLWPGGEKSGWRAKTVQLVLAVDHCEVDTVAAGCHRGTGGSHA